MAVIPTTTTTSARSSSDAKGVNTKKMSREKAAWCAAAATLVAIFFLLPFSLSRFLGIFVDAQDAQRYTSTTKWLVAGVAAVMLGWTLRNDLRRTKRLVEEARRRHQLKRKAFKAIQPQIPGRFCVFPVCVHRRFVPTSKIVALEDTALAVELATDTTVAAVQTATETALKALLDGTLGDPDKYEVVVFQGRDAGPTGLAAGVALKHGWNPSLPSHVGSILMDASDFSSPPAFPAFPPPSS